MAIKMFNWNRAQNDENKQNSCSLRHFVGPNWNQVSVTCLYRVNHCNTKYYNAPSSSKLDYVCCTVTGYTDCIASSNCLHANAEQSCEKHPMNFEILEWSFHTKPVLALRLIYPCYWKSIRLQGHKKHTTKHHQASKSCAEIVYNNCKY